VALETGTYIDDLVATNPTGSDPKSEGDDHIRLLKSTIKATFPNITAAVTPTHTELNYVDGVTSSIQDQLDAKMDIEPPACRVNRNVGNETLVSNTRYGIAGSFSYNRGSFTAGAAIGGGGARLVIPKTGLYLICMNVYFQPATGWTLVLESNSTTTLAQVKSGNNSLAESGSAQFITELTAGDYLNYFVPAGSNVLVNTAYGTTELNILYIG
jgi:hypothetical protein